jgi:AcrR family transcriptional regulator
MTQTDQSEQNEERLAEAVAGDEPALTLDDNPADLADPAATTVAAAAAADPSTHVDTRQRILDVALDLFIEQGFDGTSLRQIAERLGVTKAALYYYFESKDDILLALHMRIHEFGQQAFLSMGDGPVTLEQWGELVDEIAGQMLSQRKIFLMHERNQAALEKLHNEEHDAEHEDIQNKLRQVLADPRVPLADRIKMAASVGVVFSGLVLSGEAFDGVSDEELGGQLRGIIHNVLFG